MSDNKGIQVPIWDGEAATWSLYDLKFRVLGVHYECEDVMSMRWQAVLRRAS